MPESAAIELAAGEIVWIEAGETVGREQRGRRPALVVGGEQYLAVVSALALVIPLTSVDRGWPNHVEVETDALGTRSWAMTEQLRAISRERIVGRAGRTSERVLAEVRVWLADFLEL